MRDKTLVKGDKNYQIAGSCKHTFIFPKILTGH